MQSSLAPEQIQVSEGQMFLGPSSRRAAIATLSAAFCLVGSASLGIHAPVWLAAATGAEANPQKIPVLRGTVVNAYPHDPQAFTQGLEYFDGYLYESTGRSGQSTVRQSILETGAVIKRVKLPEQYFGEGLTIFRGKIYQLTWLTKVGFIYDLTTFAKVGEFHYDFEGWGLTHDDASLILSDGTNRLRFLDPASFNVARTIEVYAGAEAVTNLNELEYINGKIFANVWHSDRIARIDPKSGKVTDWIDLSPVVARGTHEQEDVLNGIAYDAKRKRLFVTGKNWPELFEIKVEPGTSAQLQPKALRPLLTNCRRLSYSAFRKAFWVL
jgi:glutaminyl-peptide cyclotransferase